MKFPRKHKHCGGEREREKKNKCVSPENGTLYRIGLFLCKSETISKFMNFFLTGSVLFPGNSIMNECITVSPVFFTECFKWVNRFVMDVDPIVAYLLLLYWSPTTAATKFLHRPKVVTSHPWSPGKEGKTCHPNFFDPYHPGSTPNARPYRALWMPLHLSCPHHMSWPSS